MTKHKVWAAPWPVLYKAIGDVTPSKDDREIVPIANTWELKRAPNGYTKRNSPVYYGFKYLQDKKTGQMFWVVKLVRDGTYVVGAYTIDNRGKFPTCSTSIALALSVCAGQRMLFYSDAMQEDPI